MRNCLIGGFLNFQNKTDKISQNSNYNNEYGVTNKDNGVEFYFDLDIMKN